MGFFSGKMIIEKIYSGISHAAIWWVLNVLCLYNVFQDCVKFKEKYRTQVNICKI